MGEPEPNYVLKLEKITNPTEQGTLISYDGKIDYLAPSGSKNLNYLVPDSPYALKTLTVEGDYSYVFNISKAAHVLTVTDSISRASKSLTMTHHLASCNLRIDQVGICIEDTMKGKSSLVCGDVSAIVYHFIVRGKELIVEVSNK